MINGDVHDALYWAVYGPLDEKSYRVEFKDGYWAVYRASYVGLFRAVHFAEVQADEDENPELYGPVPNLEDYLEINS